MAASLLIYTKPHTGIPPPTLDALLDIARIHRIDAAEKPRAFSWPHNPALELEVTVSDQHALERLMLALRHWSEQLELYHAVDLRVCLFSPAITIELVTPAYGSKRMAAVCADIIESVRLLDNAALLQHISRIFIIPGRPYCDVRADIDQQPAYLISNSDGKIFKAPGAGDVPPAE